MAGHAAAVAGEAQMLLCGRLDINLLPVYAQGVGDVLLHLQNIVPELRPLGNDRRIHIAHIKSRPEQLLLTKASNFMEEIPAYWGEVSGKCCPMSPSPAAPKSASITA